MCCCWCCQRINLASTGWAVEVAAGTAARLAAEVSQCCKATAAYDSASDIFLGWRTPVSAAAGAAHVGRQEVWKLQH